MLLNISRRPFDEWGPRAGHLCLANNRLASLDALRPLAHLQVLDASRNRLKTLRGVEGLGNLRVLHAHSNSLNDDPEPLALPLEGLAHLEELWLGNNGLEEPSVLLGLSRVGSLRVLELAPNHLLSKLGGEYRLVGVGLFPYLRWLDGNAVIYIGAGKDGAFAFTERGRFPERPVSWRGRRNRAPNPRLV